MTFSTGFLTIIAQSATNNVADNARTTYEFARLGEYFDTSWFYASFGAALLAMSAYAIWMVRRDAIELHPALRVLLAGLRLTAIVSLAWYFLGFEKRTDRETREDSRVVALVDRSLSMGLSDNVASGIPAGPTRVEQVVAVLESPQFLRELQQKQEVDVVTFSERPQTIRSFPRLESQDAGAIASQPDAGGTAQDRASDSEAVDEFSWGESLAPHGMETRIGDAVREVLTKRSGGPLAGIVLFSDGQQNAGIDIDSAIDLAKEADIPIHVVGVGSTDPHRNLRISDVVAPARAFPKDKITLSAQVRGQGFSGRVVTVTVTRKSAGGDFGEAIDSQQVALPRDGESLTVPFTLEPEEVGKWTYRVEVEPPAGDLEPLDNAYEVDLEVIDRDLKVLLIASGASREYRFLRNQLHRDPHVQVDVLLQSAPIGISQDAHEVLTSFPSTTAELFEYDVIVGFDPHWQELTVDELDLLGRWIADEAGGLVLVAGPIHTATWWESQQFNLLRDLYPVEFRRRFALLGDARYGSTTAWPLVLTRDGQEANFLNLTDESSQDTSPWQDFDGVYGNFAVRGTKPAATVYSRYSDPEMASRGEMAPYMVGQFYGAGRVFYMGSGEMWRLRRHDPGYFEVFYTKLLRHVSEGRLLRGSTRGTLLVERERYLLGDLVPIRARLRDEQHNPYSMSQVSLRAFRPDGTGEELVLRAVEGEPGVFGGQLRVLQEGAYQLVLPVPGEETPLSRRIQVRIPDLEREHPQRNEAVLARLANETGANYYTNVDAAVLGNQDLQPVAKSIPSRAEITIHRGAPDPDFAREQMLWILGVFCGVLTLEWLVRRFCKLA